jgi:hypothetical protein
MPGFRLNYDALGGPAGEGVRHQTNTRQGGVSHSNPIGAANGAVLSQRWAAAPRAPPTPLGASQAGAALVPGSAVGAIPLPQVGSRATVPHDRTALSMIYNAALASGNVSQTYAAAGMHRNQHYRSKEKLQAKGSLSPIKQTVRGPPRQFPAGSEELKGLRAVVRGESHSWRFLAAGAKIPKSSLIRNCTDYAKRDAATGMSRSSRT